MIWRGRLSRKPSPFGLGVLLAWEEHEQECDDPHHLLVAQLQLEG